MVPKLIPAVGLTHHSLLTIINVLGEKKGRSMGQHSGFDWRDAFQLRGEPSAASRRGSALRAIIKARRDREALFPAGLFSDPAWDMLLALYEAHESEFPLTVSGLCRASATPDTTALRWIGALERAGLVNRRNDPFHGKRVFIQLSRGAVETMGAYFSSRNALAIS